MSLNHISKGNSNLGRYIIARENPKFSHININHTKVDLTSSIGDWLSLFKSFLSIRSYATVTCTGCGPKRSKKMYSNSMNVSCIDTGTNETIIGRMTTTTYNNCHRADVALITHESDCQEGSSQLNDCLGIIHKTVAVDILPPVLCVLGSDNNGDRYLFDMVAPFFELLNTQFILHSVVVTNGSHFKSLVKIDGTKWLHYDGLAKFPHYSISDISLFNQSQVLDFQGKGYGIVSVFYIRDKDEYGRTNNGNQTAVSNMVFDSTSDMYSSSATAKLPKHVLANRTTNSSVSKEQNKFDRYGNFFGKRTIDAIDIEATDMYDDDIIEKDSIISLKSSQTYKDTSTVSLSSTLEYATRDTVLSVEEECEMDFLEMGAQINQKFVRNKEPLFVGDVVEYYNPVYVYGHEHGKETASVTHIYSGTKSIVLNSSFTFQKEDRVRRIVGYNKNEKKQLRQNGLVRLVGEFELNNVQPVGITLNVQTAAEVCDNIIENRTKKMKKSLNDIGNPYADFIVEKKNKRS